MVPKTFKSKASSIFDVLNEVNFVSDYVELILKWFFIKAICNFYHLNLNILIGRNIWSYTLKVLLKRIFSYKSLFSFSTKLVLAIFSRSNRVTGCDNEILENRIDWGYKRSLVVI